MSSQYPGDNIFSIPLSCSTPYTVMSDQLNDNPVPTLSSISVPHLIPRKHDAKIDFSRNGMSNLDTSNDDSVKRLKHTLSEQKRRDAIKYGYQQLQLVVMPKSDQGCPSSQSISKVSILKNALSFIKLMEEKLLAMENSVTDLSKDTRTVTKRQDQFCNSSSMNRVCRFAETECVFIEEIAIDQLFTNFLEYLFLSFSDNIDISSFDNLNNSISTWIEVFCTPKLILGILHRFYHFEIDFNH